MLNKHWSNREQINEVCRLLIGKGFSDDAIVDYLVKELEPNRALASEELFDAKRWMDYERR